MCPIVILGILIISAPSFFFFFFLFSLLEQCFNTANFQLIIMTKLGGLKAYLVFHFYTDFTLPL